jgi:hypothetical protein
MTKPTQAAHVSRCCYFAVSVLHWSFQYLLSSSPSLCCFGSSQKGRSRRFLLRIRSTCFLTCKPNLSDSNPDSQSIYIVLVWESEGTSPPRGLQFPIAKRAEQAILSAYRFVTDWQCGLFVVLYSAIMRSNTFFSAALGELIISEGFSFPFCGELPSFMLFRRRWCEVVDDVSDSVMATRFSKLIGHIDNLFF